MAEEPGQPKVRLRIRVDVERWLVRLFFALVSIELAIVLFDVFLNHYEWIPWRALRRSFNITREDGLGNWFSSTQSLVTGGVLVLIYLRVRAAADTANRKGERRGWLLLALFFIYMAIDDAVKLHERVGTSFEEMAENVHGDETVFSVFPSYSWQLVFGPVLAAIGLFLLWFLWQHLATRNQRLGMVAAFACLAVAVLMDLVEGMDAVIPAMSVHAVEHFMKVVEEFLEMLGNSFFLVIFLAQLLTGLESAKLELAGTESAESSGDAG